jgi:hypothetical protein
MLWQPRGLTQPSPYWRRGQGSASTWTTVYTWGGGAADDTGFSGTTFVAVIAFADFSATGGSRIRLTFDGAATEGFIADAMYLGNGGGTDAFDFGATPVQVLMSGGGTITVGAGTSGVVTDDVAFVKDGSNSFVISAHFADSAHDNMRRASGGGNSWYKPGVSEASTVNKTSYTANIASSYIAKIELLIP